MWHGMSMTFLPLIHLDTLLTSKVASIFLSLLSLLPCGCEVPSGHISNKECRHSRRVSTTVCPERWLPMVDPQWKQVLPKGRGSWWIGDIWTLTCLRPEGVLKIVQVLPSIWFDINSVQKYKSVNSSNHCDSTKDYQVQSEMKLQIH